MELDENAWKIQQGVIPVRLPVQTEAASGTDQSGINPGIIGMIRDDLVRVLSRYAQIDAGAVELRLIRPEKDGKQAFLITAAFPVRQITTVQSHLDSYMTRNEECS